MKYRVYISVAEELVTEVEAPSEEEAEELAMLKWQDGEAEGLKLNVDYDIREVKDA